MHEVFLDMDFDKIYEEPSSALMAKAFLNRLYRKLHVLNFSLLIAFYGRHRCLTAGNKVLMADGTWKNIEDVIVGDSVFSPQKDGSVIASRVMEKTNYFCENVYDVVEAKGKHRLLYSCSNNHKIPLLTYCSNRNGIIDGKDLPRTLSRKIKEYSAEYVSTIKNAKQSRMITFTSPPIDFKKSDDEIDPYCLGLWLGDGSCSVTMREYSKSFLEKNPSKKNSKNICYGLNITTNDHEIICSFKQRYDEITSIGSKQKTTAVSLGITTTGLFFKQLQKLQLIGTKSGTKFIPDSCLFSSIDFRLQLLAGLIDTDGYINYNSNVIEVTSKSLRLANDILNMVCSLGGNGTITKIKKKIKSINFEGTYYTARFAFSKERLSELVKHVQVKRKKERILNHIDIACNTCSNHKNYDPRNISIKCIPTEPKMVYGFVLDSESHWFITNNWVVTCNSGKSLSAISLCFLLDKTFEECMETRIVYTSKQFLDAVRIIRDKKIKGAGIIFDEAGSSDLASQKWYEEASRVMSAELQAIGYLNPLICFVTQNFSFINTHARKLSQGVFEVERTNNLYTTIRPFWVESSPWTSGYFHRYPIFCEVRHGVASNIYKANRLKLHLPPSEIMERYEAHAQAFKDQLLEQSREGIEQVEMQKERSKSNLNLVNETVEYVVHAPDQFMSGYNLKRGVKTLDINLLRHFFKISYSDARMVKVLAERNLGNKS